LVFYLEFHAPLQREGGTAPEPNPAGVPAGTADQRVGYRANTNLEQISDWLTKILVGVGLTQIKELQSGLISLSAFAAQGLGAQAHSQVFAFVLLSYYAVVGFLFGYLWTRLFLAGALRVADQAALGELTAEVQRVKKSAELADRKVEDLKKQVDLDAEALSLASRHLNPVPDLPKVTQEEMDAAVALASPPVKVQLFNNAWQIRSDTWRDPSTKEKMERTIMIFKALINSDVDHRYHLNHGQLGFALKDKLIPDWAEAEKELSLAIEMQGPWKENHWLFYEFNRAICRIMMDPEYARDQASDPANKKKLLEDLRACAYFEDMRSRLKSNEVIQKWMSLNGIHEKDLNKG